MMRVVVTGGRNNTDIKQIWENLDILHKQIGITCIRHGDARGVDRLCKAWAQSHGIAHEAFPAHWDNVDAPGAKIRYNAKGPYNANAGTFRNQLMLDCNPKPDHAIVFPGGAGTMDMYRRVKTSGIPYTLVE